MREVEQSLQQFSEFLLRGRLVRANAAPYVVGWVRQFLNRPATVDPLVDRVRRFCEDLERVGRQDWQVRQAEHALRIYFAYSDASLHKGALRVLKLKKRSLML